MKKLPVLLFIPVMLGSWLTAAEPDMDTILDGIHRYSLKQDAMRDSLGSYSYVQKVQFSKLDGDGAVDEKSIREFKVFMRPGKQIARELIAARDFEDDVWVDVTEQERDKKNDEEGQSQKFDMAEVVGPDARANYRFKYLGYQQIGSHQTLHLHVEPLETDEEKFTGELWVEAGSYAVVKAKLIPSEMPTGVEQMVIIFEMEKHGNMWLPATVFFDASISFLLVFNGRIISEIAFEDYLFNQAFPDSVFQATKSGI